MEDLRQHIAPLAGMRVASGCYSKVLLTVVLEIAV